MSQLTLGIDVGGTNIRMGLVDSRGRIIARKSFSTRNVISSKHKLIAGLLEHCHLLLQEYGLKKKNIRGIGIGLPGLIDSRQGLVHLLPNIPGWRNVPFKKIFEKKIGIPTYLENDVNLITLGEWRFGAGRGASDMICMTLGTGVGSGLILDNRLYRGEGFAAGELGHVPVNEKGPVCNCGGIACLERYVGNRYLTQKVRRIFNKTLSLEEVTRLADRGHPRALKFWKETGEHIGNALTGVVNVLNPSMIIIGGGISNAHRHLFKTIRHVIRERAMKVQGGMVRIVRAQLGNDAGIIGSRVLIKNAKSF